MINTKIWGTEELLYLYPCITKLIKTKDNLSIQVHENKSEVFINHDKDTKAKILYLNPLDLNKKSLEDWVNGFITNPDDSINKMKLIELKYMESITIPKLVFHAILSNSTILELSNMDDKTLRVFDWNRKSRDLHISEIKKLFNID